jgi:hypothetical protein
MKRCPCCGQPIGEREVALARIKGAPFGPVGRRIAEALGRHTGEWRTASQLADEVYADDPDGGPINAAKSIQAIICISLRAALRRAGLELESYPSRSGGYRLTVLLP